MDFMTGINIYRFVDQTLNTPGLPPLAQKKSLRLLYGACGHNAVISSALNVVVDYKRTGVEPYRGGYADVWKDQCSGLGVRPASPDLSP